MFLSPIPSFRDQIDIQWGLSEGETSRSIAFASVYAPRVGCQDSVRTNFWQRLFASVDDVVRALRGVSFVIVGDSNVWLPGIIVSHPPRNADRSCLELIRLLLDAFNV